MSNIDHGEWVVYQPISIPEGAPAHALFARRKSDGVDWYDYVNSNIFGGDSSVKFAVRSDGVVGPATYDPTAIFPAGHKVYEMPNCNINNPQAVFGNKLYDATSGKFTEQPPPEDPVTKTLNSILARLELLEKK